MRRQIDPNLNNEGSSDILFDIATSNTKPAPKKQEGFSINDVAESKEVDPQYKVIDKPEASRHHHHHHHHHHSEHSSSDKDKIVENINNSLKEKNEASSSGHHSSGEHHSNGEHHHHHSSSGHHHHHSSGSHHSHHSHHHKKKKKKKLPLPIRIVIAVVIILLLIALIVTGTFFYLQHKGKQDIMPTNVEEPAYEETIEYKGHTYKFNENVFSVAFLGVDQEDLKESEDNEFVGAADTDIVLAVDTKTGAAKAIAIPRDTMVDVDIFSENGIFLRTQKAQLCLAYAYGYGGERSCNNSISSISRILYNVPIEKYFTLDLKGIAPLNDAIGGVTVNSLYHFDDYGIKVGDEVTLKGDMAEAYVRQRDMYDINASLNRTDRQVQYIKAYAKQLAPAVMQNFGTVQALYKTASNYSETNLTLSNATYVASLLLQKGVSSFDTYTISGEMAAAKDPLMENVVHAEFTPDEDSVMEAVLAAFYIQID